MDSEVRLEQELRRRIRNELHDGPIQLVVGSKFLAESVLAQLEMNEQISATELRTVIELLGRAVQDTRRLLTDFSGTIDWKREEDWIKSLTDWVQVQINLHHSGPTPSVQVNLSHDLNQLPDQWRETLFRVCREAIQNALLHAKSQQILIAGAIREHSVEIHIRDDGIGCDSHNIPLDHFGLTGMRERIEAIGGIFEFHSVPGEGTEIRCKVQLSAGFIPVGSNN